MIDKYVDLQHSIEDMLRAAFEDGYYEGHNDGLSCGHSLAPKCRCLDVDSKNESWKHSDTQDAIKGR